MDIDESFKLEEDKFKDRIHYVMKENLTLSILSFLWNYILNNLSDTSQNKDNIEKEFISFWKENIKTITQEQIGQINQILNDENIDMLNLITENKNIADIEDYQEIINECIKETESIFWKICGKEK